MKREGRERERKKEREREVKGERGESTTKMGKCNRDEKGKER